MKTFLFTILVCSLSLNTVFAQSTPRLPERAAQIVQQLYERNLDLATGSDDQRRALTRKIIEQIICEFPDGGFNGKSASPTRPFSKDSIAKKMGDRLYSWDWQDGTTRRPNTYPNKSADHDITGQHYWQPALTCVNHLGTSTPDPTSTPTPVPESDTDAISELHAEVDAFMAEARAQWAAEQARDEALRASLEAHREEARKTRNAVIAWLTNWRNVATVAGGVLAGVFAR